MLYDTIHPQNQYGCEPFNRYTEDNPIVGDSPFILVKKGLCSCTQKVKNIEEAGGHVAIIVNDQDGEIEEDSFLSDDGRGGEISIPAILISRNDGEKIINYYNRYKDNKEEISKIRFEIKFDIENRLDIVEYDIWYTPDIEDVYIFLKDFQKYHKSLGDSIELGIHFVTYPHFMYDPNTRLPKEDCLGSGLYCIRPGKLGITDGSLIVHESIKQKCIYDYAIKYKKIDFFLNYMSNFYDTCIITQNFNQICSNNALYSTGINKDEINDCIYNSFSDASTDKQNSNYQKISKNKILDDEYELRKDYSISRVPSLTINRRLYVGTWKPEYVFDALCASLIKKPEACLGEGKFNKELTSSSYSTSYILILIVILINIILFLLCRGYIKEQVEKRIRSSNINSKIDTVVNSYIALKDNNENK